MYCIVITLEKNSINENIDLEYVNMEVLQNENVMEIQPTTNLKNDVKGNFLPIVIKYNFILTQDDYNIIFK